MPDIGQPSETAKNSPNEIRDGVVSDSTRFPGGFIDEQITESGAPLQITGQFEVTTATHTRTFSVSPRITSARSIAVSSDGSRIHVLDSGGTDIVQYNLSTAFDVSTASVDDFINVQIQDDNPQGLVFRPDGSQMYVAGTRNDKVFEFSLSTGFNISTASFTQSFDVSTQTNQMKSVAIASDGTRLYTAGDKNVNVYQYDLSTAFDVSTASFNTSFDVQPQASDPKGVAFSDDGNLMYVVDTSADTAFEYSLSTAFDISTASFVSQLDVSSEDTDPAGLTFKPDGDQLYLVGDSDDNVYQYTVGVVGKEFV